MYRLALFISLFILTSHLYAQVLPAEGRTLNYRIIGFTFPQEEGINKYTLEIAAGNYEREDSFVKNRIQAKEITGNKIIAEVPAFGSRYTWRTVYTGKGNKNINSDFHHFSTGYCREADTNNTRVRVTKRGEKYKNDYFFLDNNRCLYDMDGRPVWYLPDSNGFMDLPLDLKLSPQGTLTFILHENAYETNFNGDILWKAPNTGAISGEDQEHYHHQFSRLANGNYMAMGTRTGYILKQPSAVPDTDFVIDDIRSKQLIFDNNYEPFAFGTLIEYDKKGKVIWSWKLSDYFKKSDLIYFRKAGRKINFDMRENAFFFDEKKKVVYLGFKTCSRILKIGYPGGKVLKTYGETFEPGIPDKKNGLFYGQHACNISENGNLYLYNNNMRDSTFFPEVMAFREPEGRKGGLQEIWRYSCPGKDEESDDDKKLWFTLGVGGNVSELPDHSFFVTMGGWCAKVFIVNQDKEILWGADCEQYNPLTKKWQHRNQYRGSFLDQKDMERLVWNAGKK